MKKRIALLLTLALSLGMLAGCGGNGDSTASTPSEPSKSAATSTSDDKTLDYPTKTVEIIVPFAAGGGTDIMARAIAAQLPFTTVVTNIEGGSSSIGTMEALHRDPDGHTILCSLPESVAVYSYNGTYTEPADEMLIPIACPVTDPVVMAISANNGKFTDLEGLIAYAKEHPGELKWGASGNKSGNHAMSAMHWTDMGIDVTYVPFDGGGKARTALLGGNIDVYVDMVSSVGAYVESGDIIALCVYDSARSSYLPDVPTIAELGGEALLSGGAHRGFMATPGTPQEIVDFWADAIKTAMESEEVKEALKGLYYDPVYSDGDQMVEYMDAYREVYIQAMEYIE